MTNLENPNSSTSINNNITELEKTNIEKTIKNAGNFSIAISILGFVLTVIAKSRKYGFIEALIDTSFIVPFLIPYFYFGNKLKKQGTTNLNTAFKISKGMLIYTLFFVAINILLGGGGILWFVLIYFFYKSFKETEKLISP